MKAVRIFWAQVFSAQGKDPSQSWSFRKMVPLGTESDPENAAAPPREQKV